MSVGASSKVGNACHNGSKNKGNQNHFEKIDENATDDIEAK